MTRLRDLPLALEDPARVRGDLAGRRLAVFLDYDGTLTPIVERPEDARLAPEARDAIERLSSRCPVAIVSGRDLGDVRDLVGVPGIAYAGSHGFDIVRPDGTRSQQGAGYLPELGAAERELTPALAAISGARIERKTFAIAVHYRQAKPDRVGEIEAAVAAVAAAHPSLRRTGGKKVFELRPDLPWDKGRALRWLLEILALDGPDVVPVYLGDDETDEDAFEAIRDDGLGVVVRGEGDDRASAARYALRDPDEARVFLELLADVETGSGR